MRLTDAARRAALVGRADGATRATGGPGDEETLRERLRAVVLAALSEERLGVGSDGVTTAGLRAVCDDARGRGVPVARVVVSLKDAWRAEHPPLRPGVAQDGDRVLARMVSRCIELYYRDAT